jgi:NAD(P)-dependent dehydrogenase (short-subunit alcohol dehydrogenase family)
MSELVAGAALVTGGGSGIGRAIALALAERGAPIGVVDVSADGGRETVDLIETAGGRASFVQADAGRWDEVDRAVPEVVGELGALGILVNAAGILDAYAAADAIEPAHWERVIGINLTGTFFFCRRVLPDLLARGHGCIVNIASTAGLVGAGGGAAYVASKHGVVGLTRQMAVEYAPQGIRVNAICPGPIATNLRANSERVLGPDAPSMANVGVAVNEEQLRAVIPLGRRGTVEDIAAAACFLASDAAGYVTGHTLVVDGGWTAR